MAPPKTKKPRRSAKYYRKNKTARAKKASTDKAINSRPSQVKKRVEANRARRRAKAKGRNVTGKDASHTKNGIRFTPSSKNRGKRGEGGRKRKRK